MQSDVPIGATTGGSASSNELGISFLFMLILSSVYIAYEILTDARGGHPFGHILGIIGTILMLMTEILYSVRKRTRLLNRAGPVRHWLAFHIFTGLVGPFLVLMHTGLTFRGLAGISMLLTIIVVGSGFIGRYLYTAIPRTISGVASTRHELLTEAQRIQAALTRFQDQKSDHIQVMIRQLSVGRIQRRNPLLTVLGRSYYQWRFRRRLNRSLRELSQLERGQRAQLAKLLSRKRELDRQVEMLESARRLLRFWHILHIPFGLTLFLSVAVHVFATLYFRAGLFK